MSQQNEEGPYGFYCMETKMFYSVPSKEMYLELMAVFNQQKKTKEIHPPAHQSASQSADLDKYYSDLMD